MTKSTAFAALEALNVDICRASGAGNGLNTTPEACAAYDRIMFQRQGEVREAIYAARLAPDSGEHRFYIDGMESALARSIDAAAMGAVELALTAA